MFKIPIRISSSTCSKDCNGGEFQDPIIRKFTRITFLGGCEGNIEMNLPASCGPFQYTWYGPNGFTSRDQNLYNVRCGDYKLVFSNLTCFTKEYLVHLWD